MRRSVCVVVTSRPSYSRIRSALTAIRDHEELELQLVVAASALLDRYGNAVDVVRQDGFSVAAEVHTVLEGGNLLTMAKTTGLGMIEFASTFERLDPDVVVVIADRYEIMSAAVTAAYMNIPLAHVQGGEITGSVDEKVRHAVTKLANLHLVSNVNARDRVLRMGEPLESVHVTGCPSIDIAAAVRAQQPLTHAELFEGYGGVGPEFRLDDGYLVVLQHPVTTEYESARGEIEETIAAIRSIGLPTLWFWPNVDAGSDATSEGLRAFREREGTRSRVHFFKNLRPEDFLRLLVGSVGVVGNSSVAIRECSYLGVPAVNVGTRQQGRDRGPNVIDVPHDRDQILDALAALRAAPRPEPSFVYGNGDAGRQIAHVLATAPLTIEKRLVDP